MASLVIDGFTAQISPPKMNFNDAKTYWDGKNKIYGLKTEVAVSDTAPHYCLFVSDHVPGSMHDYLLHKQWYHNYGEYLHVTAEEARIVNNDPQRAYWLILADKGYIGPEEDTRPIKRITPVKGALTAAETRFNQEQKARRVVVEQFLGRACRLWSVFHGTWRYDWAHFDKDWRNACLLANEHIANHVLGDEDAEILRGIEHPRLEEFQARRDKRRGQVAASRNRKRQRLDQINQRPQPGLTRRPRLGLFTFQQTLLHSLQTHPTC